LDTPPKVLVIDDEEAARYGIVRALTPQGYILDEAPDGASAIAKIREFQPDVIVSDINMPGIDGLTLLQQVSAEPDAPLVVLITAYGSEEVVLQALRHGAHNYLSKPFEVSELRVIVRNAVRQQHLLRENRHYTEELHRTVAELRESQAALVQAEKLASLGRLVASLAHEINTPLGTLQASSETIRAAANKITAWVAAQPAAEAAQCRRAAEALDVSSRQWLAAVERIGGIVKNLKHFAQIDRAEFQRSQIHSGIEATLKLLEHRWEGRVQVLREFGDLPEIGCYPRQLNQLFMNLLLHAQSAVEKIGREGLIRIRTRPLGKQVELVIEHNGESIAPDDLDRIFDAAFVTRDGRVGGELGLLICQQIVHAHEGTIKAESDPDGTTRFIVTLPVSGPA
jgi:signal transduction histidine kinase